MSFFKPFSAAFLMSGALLAFPASPPAVSRTGGLPFIEDDYPRAVAVAKARHLPIFVEAWAPW